MTARTREGEPWDTEDTSRTADAGRLLRCAAVFLPGPVPRDGRIAFWDPLADAGPWHDDAAQGRSGTPFGYAETPGRPDSVPYTTARLTVVRPDPAAGPGSVRAVATPVALLSVADALPLLVRARHQGSAHPATRCWGAAALHALQLVARGRLLPGLTADGHDAWRAGPRDAEDVAHLRAVAAALPPEGHAAPVPGSEPPRLPDPEALIGSFLDAVADTLPRTPAAAFAMGAPFAAREAQHLPHAAAWAVEVASGLDAGVRVSLRLDLSAYELFDTADTYAVTAAREEAETDGESAPPEHPDDPAARHAAAAVVQVHSLADPTYVVDAVALWNGGAGEPFGPRARVDAVLALRRAARVWAPLERLLGQPVPDVLAITEDELYELLSDAGSRLAAAGVEVHWPRELARSSPRPPSCGPRPDRPPTARPSSTPSTSSPSTGSCPWGRSG